MNYYKNLFILFSAIFIFLTSLLFTGENDHAAHAADLQKATQLIEPCNLISKTEAESVMGTALSEGQYTENKITGQKICLYEAADKNSFDFLQISLTQNKFIPPNILSSGQNAKTIFTSIKDAFPDREDINKIGDDAFIAPPGIHILKGDCYLSIGAGNIKRNRDKLISAGVKAMENIEASF